MIGVTIGVGKAYFRMAELAAESVRQFTGLPVEVIAHTPGEEHPAKYKLKLLEQFPGTVFYFDADTRMVGPWPGLLEYDNSPKFVASLHDPSKAKDRDARHYKIDPRRWFYSGLWIANREHHGEAFKAAYEICHRKDYRTSFAYEQTAMNVAIQRAGCALDPIPWERHVVCDEPNQYKIPPKASVLHIAGRSLHVKNRKIFEREIFRRTPRNHETHH